MRTLRTHVIRTTLPLLLAAIPALQIPDARASDLQWVPATSLPEPSGCPWQPIYEEDFSSDPGWVTNNPGNYYWDSSSEEYFSRQIDDTEEYAYMLLPSLQDGYKWRLEYDIHVRYCQMLWMRHDQAASCLIPSTN